MNPILKYPRTQHLEGSRLQPGDEDLQSVPFAALGGCHIVVEEKVDGANAAMSFDRAGELRLQSRGHFLTGGARERHFDRFKAWAHHHRDRLHTTLGERYVLYGEWLYAKHTIFYDCLPHYFLEFDVFDREAQAFLSTPARKHLLSGIAIVSVPVLFAGVCEHPQHLPEWIAESHCKSPSWRARLKEVAACVPHVDVERTVRETDPSDAMEGLYVKVEEEQRVVARYKFIPRAS